MRRREFLGVLGGAAVTWPMVVRAQTASSTVRVGKAGREAFSFVPADVGAQTGIFKKHGLDLEISSFGGEARSSAGDGGRQHRRRRSAQVRASPSSSKARRSRGSRRWPARRCLFALMVRADDSVKTVDDLKGRKVGVSTVGSVTSWIVSEVARQKGWGFDGIPQVPIGDDATPDCRAENQVGRRRDRQSRGRPQFRPARRGPHPAPLQRSAEGLPRPRDLRHRQGHRGKA